MSNLARCTYQNLPTCTPGRGSVDRCVPARADLAVVQAAPLAKPGKPAKRGGGAGTVRKDMERLACQVPAIHTHLEGLLEALQERDDKGAARIARTLHKSIGNSAELLSKLQTFTAQIGGIQ